MSDLKIDFCVPLTGSYIGPHADKFNCLTDMFAPILFNSLFSNANTSNITFHILDNTKDEKTKHFLEEFKAKLPEGVFNIYPPLEVKTYHSSSFMDVTPVVNVSVATNSNWMIKNCGNNEWVILSHFDILFKKDIIKLLLRHLSHDVGLIGSHSDGIMMINRKAFNMCCVGFESFSGFYVIPIEDGSGQYYIRFGDDPRCTNHNMMVRGFDNGELLEINIQIKGWKFVPLNKNELMDYMWHIGSGSGHAGDEANKLKRKEWENYV